MKNRFWSGLGGVLMGAGILGIVLTAWAANEQLKTDRRGNPVMGAVTDDANLDIRMLRVDPATGELLTKTSGGGGDASAANQLLIIAQIAAGQNATEPVVISIGTTATLISAANGTKRKVTMQHMGTTDIFLGKVAVTTTTGIGLKGGTVANDLKGQTAVAKHGDDIYGIVTSGTANLRVQVVSD